MHASGMAAGAKAGKLSVREISKSGEKYDRPIRTTPAVRLFLISGYAVFALALGYAFGSWIVPLYFFVSVLSKFFSQKATGEMFRAGLTALLFLCTIFFVFLIAPLIVRIFPFSQAVLSQHPDGTFTSPVDAPQVLLVWGVLYFLALGVTETVLLFKKPKM